MFESRGWKKGGAECILYACYVLDNLYLKFPSCSDWDFGLATCAVPFCQLELPLLAGRSRRVRRGAAAAPMELPQCRAAPGGAGPGRAAWRWARRPTTYFHVEYIKVNL